MGKLKIMGKQKTPGGIPPGDFCFPTVRDTLNNRIFISRWFITVIPENAFFHFLGDKFRKKFKTQKKQSVQLFS